MQRNTLHVSHYCQINSFYVHYFEAEPMLKKTTTFCFLQLCRNNNKNADNPHIEWCVSIGVMTQPRQQREQLVHHSKLRMCRSLANGFWCVCACRFANVGAQMHSKLQVQHSAQTLKRSGKFTRGRAEENSPGASTALTINGPEHSARARRNTMHSRHISITEVAVRACATGQRGSVA